MRSTERLDTGFLSGEESPGPESAGSLGSGITSEGELSPGDESSLFELDGPLSPGP